MVTYTKQLADLQIVGNAVTLELTQDWLQGRSGYGGWQAALAVKAMRALLGDELPLRSLQVNFIAPVPAGRVTAYAELLRRGKIGCAARGEDTRRWQGRLHGARHFRRVAPDIDRPSP